jgi:hypothetical protein
MKLTGSANRCLEYLKRSLIGNLFLLITPTQPSPRMENKKGVNLEEIKYKYIIYLQYYIIKSSVSGKILINHFNMATFRTISKYFAFTGLIFEIFIDFYKYLGGSAAIISCRAAKYL